MKQLHLSLKKEILLVEGSHDINKVPNTDPDAFYELIGKLSDLTEMDYKGLVEQVIIRTEVPTRVVGYIDVIRYIDYSHEYRDQYLHHCQTAKESFESAVEAEGYHLENPLGEFDDFDKQVYNHSTNRLTEWKAAESRTFHPNQTYLFEIVNQ